MDEELLFDPSLKKKKKKKTAFDPDAAFGELEAQGAGDEEPTAKPDKSVHFDDSADGEEKEEEIDLNSLGKKKKKKKKTFDLGDMKEALPELDTAVGGGESDDNDEDGKKDDMDFDMDFTKFKKKKMKKKKVLDELVTGLDGKDGAEPDVPVEATAWFDTDRDYTYDELLTRAFDIMREKNPEMASGEKKKFVMKPPQVVRVGTKKVSFVNFTDICRLLHRQQKHVLQFLLAELGTQGSVDGNSQLIIKGRFQQKQIENVLRRYIKEYVTCHTCRSPETILQKDTRLFFLQCETCGSRCSVASIKSGYQAVTGKRAAQRAKNA